MLIKSVVYEEQKRNAGKVSLRNNTGKRSLSVYNLDIEKAKQLLGYRNIENKEHMVSQ